MKKIFIIEDDTQLRRLYQTSLEMYGYIVIGQASDGIQAVEMFKEFSEKPDLIIMDHRMPNKNGIEASKEILEIDKSAIILFASADEDLKSEVYSLGIRFFLVKPFKLSDLIKTIGSAT